MNLECSLLKLKRTNIPRDILKLVGIQILNKIITTVLEVYK